MLSSDGTMSETSEAAETVEKGKVTRVKTVESRFGPLYVLTKCDRHVICYAPKGVKWRWRGSMLTMVQYVNIMLSG
jgi:hypothetical protein